jgi:hypothetical protein
VIFFMFASITRHYHDKRLAVVWVRKFVSNLLEGGGGVLHCDSTAAGRNRRMSISRISLAAGDRATTTRRIATNIAKLSAFLERAIPEKPMRYCYCFGGVEFPKGLPTRHAATVTIRLSFHLTNVAITELIIGRTAYQGGGAVEEFFDWVDLIALCVLLVQAVFWAVLGLRDPMFIELGKRKRPRLRGRRPPSQQLITPRQSSIPQRAK